MRVLQINAVYGYGSTGMIVRDIHNLLLGEGIESFVAYSIPFGYENEVEDSYRIGSAADRKLHALLSRVGGKQGYYSRAATKGLIRYIESIKPHVVHLHNIHNNYLNLPLICDHLKKKDIATVITLHDCWYYTGGCYHYHSVDCNKWTGQCGNCVKRLKDTPAYLYDSSKQILRDRERFFCQMEKLAVVGVSGWISDEARRSVFSNKKIYTVYNGIDTEFFRPVEGTIRKKLGLEDKFVILGFANKWLDPQNGALLKKLSALAGDKVAIIIAGCTSDQMGSVPKGIIPLGYISDRSELRDLYSSCDLFVNCTHEESLSMVNVEAQACGTPIVTFGATGAGETADGISSFRVDDGDSCGFIDKVMLVMSIGKQKFSAGCRAFVCERFNNIKNYTDYVKIYKEVSGFENKNR